MQDEPMSFEQNDKTRNFIETVKKLIESGEVRNQATIVDALKWDKTLMSNVMNGRKNVPNDVYRKFTELFQVTTPPTDADFRDKYISMLEQQVKDRDRQLAELKDRMDSRTLQITDQIEKLQASLKEVVREQKATLSYAKTLYDSVIEHRAALEGDSPKIVKSKMDKLLSDHFAQSAETDSR